MQKLLYFILISNLTLPLLTEFEKEQEHKRQFSQSLEFHKSLDNKCLKAQELTQKAFAVTFASGNACLVASRGFNRERPDLVSREELYCCGCGCCCFATGICFFLCSNTISCLRSAIKSCLLKNHED